MSRDSLVNTSSTPWPAELHRCAAARAHGIKQRCLRETGASRRNFSHFASCPVNNTAEGAQPSHCPHTRVTPLTISLSLSTIIHPAYIHRVLPLLPSQLRMPNTFYSSGCFLPWAGDILAEPHRNPRLVSSTDDRELPPYITIYRVNPADIYDNAIVGLSIVILPGGASRLTAICEG